MELEHPSLAQKKEVLLLLLKLGEIH